MDINLLEVKDENIKMVVLVRYFQSECLYILRKDGNVISTDNLNGLYSITKGEDLTKEFIDLFSVNCAELSDKEFEDYEEKVQLFLNKTQALNNLIKPDANVFLSKLNDAEALSVIRYANCL